MKRNRPDDPISGVRKAPHIEVVEVDSSDLLYSNETNGPSSSSTTAFLSITPQGGVRDDTGVLASIPLDADHYTYEALCTTGICHVKHNSGSTAEASYLAPLEKTHNNNSNQSRGGPCSSGDYDARLDVLEEVHLCNVVPVIPRTVPFRSLVQQVVPCTLFCPGHAGSSSEGHPTVFSVLRAAQREHLLNAFLDLSRQAPLMPAPIVHGGIHTNNKKRDAKEEKHTINGKVKSEEHSLESTEPVSVDERMAAGSRSPADTDTELVSSEALRGAEERFSGNCRDERDAQSAPWVAARSEGPGGAVVEWSCGLIGFTRDTSGLHVEQLLRAERNFGLPATPYCPCSPSDPVKMEVDDGEESRESVLLPTCRLGESKGKDLDTKEKLTLPPTTLRGAALTQLSRLRQHRRERAVYFHGHCEHRRTVRALARQHGGEPSQQHTSLGMSCASVPAPCQCRSCYKYDAIFAHLTPGPSALYSYLRYLHTKSTFNMETRLPESGCDDRTLDPRVALEGIRGASSVGNHREDDVENSSWSWVDDSVLDEIVLVAVAPRGLPYEQALLPLSHAYVMLLSRALEDRLSIYEEAVLPMAMSASPVSADSARSREQVLRQYRLQFIQCIKEGTDAEVWNACMSLDAFNVKDRHADEGDSQEKDGADASSEESHLQSIRVFATSHVEYAMAACQDHFIHLLLAAMQTVMHRRTFITYEIMRLLSSKSLFMANKALVDKYKAWLVDTPSPGAVLRLLSRSNRWRAAVKRQFPEYFSPTAGASCGVGFVPEAALLQSEYLPRFSAWVLKTYHGGQGDSHGSSSHDAALNAVLRAMTRKGRTLTLAEVDHFIASVVSHSKYVL